MTRSSSSATAHETPSDKAIYRHTETDDEVKYMGRTDEQYLLRINSERSMTLDVRDWEQYREFLEVDRYE